MQFASLFLLLSSLQAITLFILGQETLDVEELQAARVKWETLQEDLGPLDYKYLITDISEGNDGPVVSVIVMVEQDNATEVEQVFFLDDEEPVPDDYLTVNAMFDLMEMELEAGSIVTSVFDRTYGFPLEYIITNEDEEVVQSVIIDPMTIYSLAQHELDTHLALWNKRATLDYDYTLRLSCFCIPSATTPKSINVRDGAIENITDIDTGLEAEDLFYNTIEEQFDEIQGAIDERWFVVDARYNETLGYPLRFFFDVHPGIADEERATEISDVVILGEPLPDLDDGIAFTEAEPAATGRPTLAPTMAATEGSTDGGMQSTTVPTSRATVLLGSTSLAVVSVVALLVAHVM
jgi:hypothetical protein